MLFVAPRVFRGPRVLSCGPGCCMCRWAAARPRAVRAASFARRVVSKPGQAPQASRRPPIGRGACLLPGQALPPPTGAAARPRSCGLPMALRDRQRARLKPPSPLLVRACVGLKLPSPLRARNERFWCSFRVQRCRWFQWLRFGGEHWCCGFQSPASECTVRDFFRPARPRVRASAKKFAPHAQNGRKTLFSGALGELFRGNAAGGGVLGEFFRGNADGGGVLGCNSGAGSRRIPPRIASPYHERPASHADAPRPR